MTTTTQTPVSTASRSRLRALGVIGAVLAATTIWLIADPVLGNDLVVETWSGEGTTQVELAHVVATSLIVSLAGWGTLAALENIAPRAQRIWTIAASFVLLLSMTGPIGSSAAQSTAVALGLMHVAVGAALIPTFARSAK